MAVGDSYRVGYDAFVSIGEETTFGTKVDSFSFVEFTSESMKIDIERKNVETIHNSRDYLKRVSLNKSVSGSIEMPVNLAADAQMYIIKQALGGTVASAQIGATGSYNHTINAGDMENNDSTSGAADVKSLCMQIRKGGTGANTGTTFDFVGNRVNTLSIKAEQGDIVYLSAEFIGKGASATSSTPTAAYADVVPMTFAGVKFEVGVSIGAALTEEYIQSFELTINNNLQSDAIARRLGSDELQILPPGMRDVSLKISTRWDTTTNYDRWLADTTTAIQITCIGPSVAAAGGSSYSMIIKLPTCYIESTPLPEVGEGGVISHEINWKCLKENTTGAYSIQMIATNMTANY